MFREYKKYWNVRTYDLKDLVLVNRMIDCSLMAAIIVLTPTTLGEKSKISLYLAIIYIIIVTIKCFYQLWSHLPRPTVCII